MKGFSHFISGLAAVSCIPGVVTEAASGNHVPFILGGVSALLPDTLDFKGVRFFWKYDVMIIPDPLKPDLQEAAEAIARAMDDAVLHQKCRSLKLCSIQLSADTWQQYVLTIYPSQKELTVKAGPVVNTSQEPVGPGIDVPEGRASFSVQPRLDYLAETKVDIFDGPGFCFQPAQGKRLHIQFLPWHRGWTHSLVTAAVLGLLVLAMMSPLAGLAVFTAYTVHILQDQFGHMGSQLFAPFSSRRYPGLAKMHALDVWPNVGAVWISLMILYWNMALHAGMAPCEGNLLRYVFLGAGLPAAAAWTCLKGSRLWSMAGRLFKSRA